MRENVYSPNVIITPRINGLQDNMFAEDVNAVVNSNTFQYLNG